MPAYFGAPPQVSGLLGGMSPGRGPAPQGGISDMMYRGPSPLPGRGQPALDPYATGGGLPPYQGGGAVGAQLPPMGAMPDFSNAQPMPMPSPGAGFAPSLPGRGQPMPMPGGQTNWMPPLNGNGSANPNSPGIGTGAFNPNHPRGPGQMPAAPGGWARPMQPGRGGGFGGGMMPGRGPMRGM